MLRPKKTSQQYNERRYCMNSRSKFGDSSDEKFLIRELLNAVENGSIPSAKNRSWNNTESDEEIQSGYLIKYPCTDTRIIVADDIGQSAMVDDMSLILKQNSSEMTRRCKPKYDCRDPCNYQHHKCVQFCSMPRQHSTVCTQVDAKTQYETGYKSVAVGNSEKKQADSSTCTSDENFLMKNMKGAFSEVSIITRKPIDSTSYSIQPQKFSRTSVAQKTQSPEPFQPSLRSQVTQRSQVIHAIEQPALLFDEDASSKSSYNRDQITNESEHSLQRDNSHESLKSNKSEEHSRGFQVDLSYKYYTHLLYEQLSKIQSSLEKHIMINELLSYKCGCNPTSRNIYKQIGTRQSTSIRRISAEFRERSTKRAKKGFDSHCDRNRAHSVPSCCSMMANAGSVKSTNFTVRRATKLLTDKPFSSKSYKESGEFLLKTIYIPDNMNPIENPKQMRKIHKNEETFMKNQKNPHDSINIFDERCNKNYENCSNPTDTLKESPSKRRRRKQKRVHK